MKILVICHEFPPVGGGGGKAAEDICKNLNSLGHEVTVLTSYHGGLSREELSTAGKIIRIPVGRKHAFKATIFDMANYLLVGFWRGLKLIISWKPDLVHVHFAVPGGALAWMLNKITGLPYVLTVHLGDVPGGSPKKTEGWFRWVYPFTPPIWNSAARVVAVSEFTKTLAQKHYQTDIEVIPNGVDLAELDPGDIRANDPPRIVFAGRFVPQKNTSMIVKVLAEIKNLEWDCVMIGDGETRSENIQEISKLGLERRVQFPGWVTPEQVVEYYKSGDILLMPSLWEGLPVVGVQALAMGLAIVSSPAGGFIDLVEDGKNGFLIRGYDLKDWSRAMEELLEDKAKLQTFRDASRLHAQKFSLDKIAKRYEDIFVAICKKV